MDEPTSALSQSEVKVLFKVIAQLKRRGVTIIYISHRLEELMEIGTTSPFSATVVLSASVTSATPAFRGSSSRWSVIRKTL